MIASLAYVFLIGLLFAALCRRVRLPRIIGMLITGVLLGPFVLDLLDPGLLSASSELRQMALIIILIKAGLALELRDLKKVGRAAVLMSFLPACFEIAGLVLFGPALLGLTRLESALLGAVLGAVSPAVVVPKMVQLIEDGRGTEQRVPQLILAGASLDDVFVIVVFSTLLGMVQGKGASVRAVLDIPVSILSGLLLGVAAGMLLSLLFALAHRKNSIRNTLKCLIMLGTAFLLMTVEDRLEGLIAVSGLIAVMAMAGAIRVKARPEVSADLSDKFGKLWLAAEVVLFVLVGAAVDIRYTLSAGLSSLALIAIGLCFRSVGTWLSLCGTGLNRKEKLFCVIAYLPKATVQAAIGGVPLALGLTCGKMILSVAVVSILITAPLGALGMDATAARLLKKADAAIGSEKGESALAPDKTT